VTIPDVAIGPFGWTCICVGSWLILLVIGGFAWHLIASRLKRRKPVVRPHWAEYPPPVPPSVRWAQFLPPVPLPTTPPLSQSVPSPDWFYDVPVDVLSDDAVRVLCDDIARREFS
jgi:hypothetical protein